MMTTSNGADSADRRITARDWVGAAVRIPGVRPSPKKNGTKFHIYRAPHARLTFAVTDGPKPPARVGLGRSIDWELVKTVEESGQRRIGFSEEQAKKAISAKGYLLVKLTSA
jgi:hypothetical protein